MTRRSKKRPPALKHGAFSAMTTLPGESKAEFKKLEKEVISESTSDGALEADAVSTVARVVWRRRHLGTFRSAELARQRMAQIRAEMVPAMGEVEFKQANPLSLKRPSSTNGMPQKAKRAKSLATTIPWSKWARRRQLMAC